MNEYNFTFKGRKVGAMGVTYFVATMVKADSFEAAYWILYERYEHIQFLKLDGSPVKRPESPGGKS